MLLRVVLRRIAAKTGVREAEPLSAAVVLYREALRGASPVAAGGRALAQVLEDDAIRSDLVHVRHAQASGIPPQRQTACLCFEEPRRRSLAALDDCTPPLTF